MVMLGGPQDREHGIGAYSEKVVKENGNPNNMIFRSKMTDGGKIHITGYEVAEVDGRPAKTEAFSVEYISGEFAPATDPAPMPRLKREVVDILTRDEVEQARQALSPDAYLATLAACEAARNLESSIRMGRRMTNNLAPYVINTLTIEHGARQIHVAPGMRDSLANEASRRIRRVFR